MGNRPRSVVVVVAIATIGGVPPTRAEGSVSRVAVQIDEKTAVDAAAMADAVPRVTSIYDRAGIEIVWKGARVTSDEALVELTVVMAANDLAERKEGREAVMGVAHPGERTCGRIAFVFYKRVKVVAEESEQKLSVVLAHVIAHELGHLLLPPSAHSRAGIMGTNWTKFDLLDASRGRLLFTRVQAAHMRARIAAEPVRQPFSGTVRDISGAPIPYARVTATHVEQNHTWEAVADDSGRFRFVALPSGSYRLALDAAGLAPMTRTVTIYVGQRPEASITLTQVSIHDEPR